jgi:hypothetical protein
VVVRRGGARCLYPNQRLLPLFLSASRREWHDHDECFNINHSFGSSWPMVDVHPADAATSSNTSAKHCSASASTTYARANTVQRSVKDSKWSLGRLSPLIMLIRASSELDLLKQGRGGGVGGVGGWGVGWVGGGAGYSPAPPAPPPPGAARRGIPPRFCPFICFTDVLTRTKHIVTVHTIHPITAQTWHARGRSRSRALDATKVPSGTPRLPPLACPCARARPRSAIEVRATVTQTPLTRGGGINGSLRVGSSAPGTCRAGGAYARGALRGAPRRRARPRRDSLAA